MRTYQEMATVPCCIRPELSASCKPWTIAYMRNRTVYSTRPTAAVRRTAPIASPSPTKTAIPQLRQTGAFCQEPLGQAEARKGTHRMRLARLP